MTKQTTMTTTQGVGVGVWGGLVAKIATIYYIKCPVFQRTYGPLHRQLLFPVLGPYFPVYLCVIVFFVVES